MAAVFECCKSLYGHYAFVHFWFVPENVAARCCATRIFLYFRKVYKRICSPKNRQQ